MAAAIIPTAIIPKSVTRIWRIIINENCQFLTAQKIAEELGMQPNSVLQNVHRNKDYFEIINRKPLLIGPKPLKPFFFLRDNYKCTICGAQLTKKDALIDTLDQPSLKNEMKIYNTGTVCNTCKSKRHQKKYRHLTAEEYIKSQEDDEKAKNAIKRIQSIRALEQDIPIVPRDFQSISLTRIENLSRQIYDLEAEIQSLRESISNITKTRTFEYYEIFFVQFEDEEEGFEYWGWDYDPVREYPGGDRDYWYFSKKKKVTCQGKASETTLDETLDHFGSQGYEIASIDWGDPDIRVIFKKEVR